MPSKHFENANMQALAKQDKCHNGPSKFLSKHEMFCNGFIKTHGTFRCDLQNSFEENAKERRYQNRYQVMRKVHVIFGNPSYVHIHMYVHIINFSITDLHR